MIYPIQDFDLEINENDEHNELMTATNAADECIKINVETAHGGPKNEFQISGSVILCECASTLSQK